MIAAPGGGKGTRGERLAAKFSVQHDREPDDEEQNTGEDGLKALACSAAAQRTRID